MGIGPYGWVFLLSEGGDISPPGINGFFPSNLPPYNFASPHPSPPGIKIGRLNLYETAKMHRPSHSRLTNVLVHYSI